MEKKHSRLWLVFALCVVIFSLLACDVAGASSRDTSSADNTGTLDTASASPTPAFESSGPTTLGGFTGAFLEKYGPPNDTSDFASGLYMFRSLTVSADVVDGKVYEKYIDDIMVGAPDGGWDISTGEQTCESYMPLDAQYEREVSLTDGQGQLSGYDRVYFSETLKNTFPASQFQDAQQNIVQAGLFDILYNYASPGTTIENCTLAPGTSGIQ